MRVFSVGLATGAGIIAAWLWEAVADCGEAAASPAGLRSCFQDEVEWRLGGAAHARESALPEYVAEPRLAGLRAERETDLLGERRRRADHGRGTVEDAPDRV